MVVRPWSPVPGPAEDVRMEGRPEEPGWRRVPLSDGTFLTVREVRSSDVDGLVALYDGLSGEDRQLRFFSAYRPPPEFFERLATVVDRGGYGMVATIAGDGGCDAPPFVPRIVGEANYELLSNGDGELGMVVAAGERGWLGPWLLDALMEAAAARGVPNIEAAVLVTNRRMLTLLRSRGYATVPSDDWTSVRLIVGTDGPTPVWPGGDATTGAADGPRVLIESPGGRWHATAEAEAAGLQVVACSGPRSTRRPRCPVLAGRPCPLAAEADAIVVSNVADDSVWHAIVGAHADLHAGVPVCLEPRAGPLGGRPFTTTEGGGAVTIDGVQEPRSVVAVVGRLAAQHHGERVDEGHKADEDVRP
jgi:hypothetical protein